jgi:hypothetical protein
MEACNNHDFVVVYNQGIGKDRFCPVCTLVSELEEMTKIKNEIEQELMMSKNND